MAAEKTLAIVLRTVDFSETSLVVTLFTEGFGKISGLAKGARRPKGPFESALDLLSVCRIVFLPKSSDSLDLVTEARLERRFRPPGKSLAPLYAGYYMAELLDHLTTEHDRHTELFQASESTLSLLAGGIDPVPVTLRWEMSALRLLGHLPQLEACVECGNEIALEGRIAFGLWSGGLLCGNCRPGKRHVVNVSAAVIQTLRTFADPGDAWQGIEIDNRVRGELRGLLNSYLAHLLGKRPRLQPYMGFLSQASRV